MLKNQTPVESNQDAFNRVWQHFVVEKHEKCTTVGGSCAYRQTDSKGEINGCAVGIMMTDELFRIIEEKGLNSFGVKAILGVDVKISDWFCAADARFLLQLQSVHDAFFEDFESNMRKLATLRSLEIPTCPVS